ncbi:MAG: Non-canonical purine NTP pyrophosphatase [Candidatus Ordinivivax streblomastigis]|uniref:dITP/XTP pyrophosphatase n=1 Tax=Candidatus Ordinivivax streblomastigis TaxID=2540710 RepID=A0A5M8NZG7_9BACT|nr:MAG: Non-canonical purine NTP pyrophosphatase [Candidatus Ordinivivax streblomastigis]
MKQPLVFATNNRHKLEEVQDILGDNYQVVSLQEIHCEEDIPETADTLEGNALLKARFVKERYGLDCFADDTGLEVVALNNAPGVYSARYAGEAKNSQANRQKLLQALERQADRSARFRTVIALIKEDHESLFEGIVNGEIIHEERGTTGFGYDSIFVPTGYKETFAELGADIKNTVSHRAKAVNKLKTGLNEKE